jgi:hypothetical protein
MPLPSVGVEVLSPTKVNLMLEYRRQVEEPILRQVLDRMPTCEVYDHLPQSTVDPNSAHIQFDRSVSKDEFTPFGHNDLCVWNGTE